MTYEATNVHYGSLGKQMTIKVTSHLRFMAILIYPKLIVIKTWHFGSNPFFLENPSGNLEPRELQFLLHLRQTKYGTRSHLVDEEKSEKHACTVREAAASFGFDEPSSEKTFLQQDQCSDNWFSISECHNVSYNFQNLKGEGDVDRGMFDEALPPYDILKFILSRLWKDGSIISNNVSI